MSNIKIKVAADYGRFLPFYDRLFPDVGPPETENTTWFEGVTKGDLACFAAYQTINNKAYFTCAGVLPPYRGRGLQKKLIRARERHARAAGLQEAITYVLTWNYRSAHNLLACGFEIYWPETPWVGEDVIYLRKKL